MNISRNIALSMMVLASTLASSSSYCSSTQIKKDFESLLAKPAFYQSTSTRVRYLKQLAALMILKMCTCLLPPGAKPLIKLTGSQLKGLDNLYTFAHRLLLALNGPSAIVDSACAYAFYPVEFTIRPDFWKLLEEQKGPEQLTGIFFNNFNPNYREIIKAIESTNKKKTKLPREITLDTLNMWALANVQQMVDVELKL